MNTKNKGETLLNIFKSKYHLIIDGTPPGANEVIDRITVTPESLYLYHKVPTSRKYQGRRCYKTSISLPLDLKKYNVKTGLEILVSKDSA